MVICQYCAYTVALPYEKMVLLQLYVLKVKKCLAVSLVCSDAVRVKQLNKVRVSKSELLCLHLTAYNK